jgi:hypothetical protein
MIFNGIPIFINAHTPDTHVIGIDVNGNLHNARLTPEDVAEAVACRLLNEGPALTVDMLKRATESIVAKQPIMRMIMSHKTAKAYAALLAADARVTDAEV